MQNLEFNYNKEVDRIKSVFDSFRRLIAKKLEDIKKEILDDKEKIYEKIKRSCSYYEELF